MNIGIIGAGAIGGLLAAKWVASGHAVSIANSRGPASLADLAKSSGARAVDVTDAVRDVEVVVVSIPQKNVALLPKDLFRGVPAEVVVVDTGNYYPSIRDGVIAAIEGGLTESAWVAQQIGRPVSKLFNSIMAHSVAARGLPAGTPGRIALPIAGDDPRAKRILTGLLDALGFDGVDGGSLDESWRQQPGSPAYCTDYDAAKLRSALGRAVRAHLPAARDRAIEMMMKLPPGTAPDELVRLIREIEDGQAA